jgi:hypothetical protein
LAVPARPDAVAFDTARTLALFRVEPPVGRYERWDLETGRLLESRDERRPFGDRVTMSRDGRYLFEDIATEWRQRVVVAATGRELEVPQGREPGSNVRWRERRGVFIDASTDDLRFWNPDAGTDATFTAAFALRPRIAGVSPDGAFAAVNLPDESSGPRTGWAALDIALVRWGIARSHSRTLALVATATGREVARVPDDGGDAEPREGAGAFSPDGRRLAVMGRDGVVCVYDWPLPRPWALAACVAAGPAALFALGDLVVRQLRRLTQYHRDGPRAV